MNVQKFVKTKLFKHQIECVEFGLRHNKFLLADSMGLGKTLSVITIASIKRVTKNYEHCLIICGINGLKYNWKNEIAQHTNLDCHILGYREGKQTISNADKLADLEDIDSLPYFIITNIESLRYRELIGEKFFRGKLKKIYEYPIADKISRLCTAEKINMIAFDECHVCRNPDSEQGKQLLKLNAETEIAMTGTPLLNTPLDLYMPLHWLGYEEASFFSFKRRYCRFGGYGGKEIIGYKNLEQLHKKLNGVMLRRLKEDVLDLPEKIYSIEYVEMNIAQRGIYNEVRKALLKDIDKIAASVNPLSELIRLRQATGHTSILSTKVSESAKLDRLKELVSDIIANGEKVVIFSNWKDIVDIIQSELLGYNPAIITGEVNTEQRSVEVDRFQTDKNCKVLIGTIGAAGTGITLTAASNVIFFDIPWTCGIFEQAVDRCHRIGQNKTVNIYELITKNTIDERVHDIVRQKGELSDRIVDSKALVNYYLS